MSVHISEVHFCGPLQGGFIEIAAPEATDTTGYRLAVYDSEGKPVSVMSLGAIVATIADEDIYLLDANSPNWPGVSSKCALALLDPDGAALQFISFQLRVAAVEGPAIGKVSRLVGVHTFNNEPLATVDGGHSYQGVDLQPIGGSPFRAPDILIKELAEKVSGNSVARQYLPTSPSGHMIPEIPSRYSASWRRLPSDYPNGPKESKLAMRAKAAELRRNSIEWLLN